MKDPNLSQSHLLADEVSVNLSVLRAPMVDRVCYHIDNAHVFTIDDRG
jgi:hypothetical protein